MSVAYCTNCNTYPISSETCNVSNCTSHPLLCAGCISPYRCVICEFIYCSSHLGKCTSCKSTMCAYCARKLPNDSSLYDLNCFDVQTASMTDTDIIASCPFAGTLPAPDEGVFLLFDPPIEYFTFSQSKNAGKNGWRPTDVQAEHFVPNSCFIVGKGRKGATVHGSGNYSEGKALTYWVGDDQKANTEHKYLTDCERAFCNACEKSGKFPTLGQWLDFMQHVTGESILNHRDFVGDQSGSAQDVANRKQVAAQQAAYALRYRMEQHFVGLKADLNGYLGNGVVGGLAPPKKVSKSQRYNL